MDLQPVLTSYDYTQLDWLDGRVGTDDIRTGTLDLSTFTASTFNPVNGYIPAGCPVQYNGTSHLWEAVANTATTAGALTFQNVKVNPGSTKAAAPLFTHGRVKSANLPYRPQALVPGVTYV
jgi:hypothetical protein